MMLKNLWNNSNGFLHNIPVQREFWKYFLQIIIKTFLYKVKNHSHIIHFCYKSKCLEYLASCVLYFFWSNVLPLGLQVTAEALTETQGSCTTGTDFRTLKSI